MRSPHRIQPTKPDPNRRPPPHPQPHTCRRPIPTGAARKQVSPGPLPGHKFTNFHEFATCRARPARDFGGGKGAKRSPIPPRSPRPQGSPTTAPSPRAGPPGSPTRTSPGPPPPAGPAPTIFPRIPSRHKGKTNSPPSAGKLAARSRPKRGGPWAVGGEPEVPAPRCRLPGSRAGRTRRSMQAKVGTTPKGDRQRERRVGEGRGGPGLHGGQERGGDQAGGARR